ncbi:hypothetical protein P280DRAFT_518811 [Massarina eburnea CBS 473.64]|uniref:Uncharacterized protein n=1 Tax=Massarina eburnea CBS 473.64 TaxID=1395130 RepID=A0A6A6RYG2_9PLEO|nr:hypothetical protein P280DRAFT_518811 [Massarina eburnea CBS 473.64]
MEAYLLQCPAEIRNQIYMLVLKEPGGLQYHEEIVGTQTIGKLYTRTPEGASDTHVATEANQLRFVNRQLHEETRGLGLKYNKIIFIEPNNSKEDMYAQFQRFLSNISPARKASIHAITIVITKEIRHDQKHRRRVMDSSNPLVRFAQEYPTIKVKIRHYALDNERKFLVVAFIFQHRFRGHDTFLRNLHDITFGNEDVMRPIIWHVQRELRFWCPQAGDAQPFPDNIRIFPSNRWITQTSLLETMRKPRHHPFWTEFETAGVSRCMCSSWAGRIYREGI